ncbi:MAG: hypothetical protein JO267_02280 [Alphaproteobacteria bacterium]|nr:hypothetical protein [Alphaproteobacteria bacterium]
MTPTGEEVPYPPKNFGAALAYAYDTQKNYSEWLDHQADINLGAGLAEVALAGTALGLGTVGGSTDAVAALATAAGATIAADQWVVGVPGKDPRYKLFAGGIAQLQCVIDDSWAAAPRTMLAAMGPKPDDLAPIIAKLGSDGSVIAADASALLMAEQACNSGDAEVTGAARLAAAQASLAVQRAAAVATTLAGLPAQIVSAVHGIHWQAYAQVMTSLPDIGQIKVTAVGGASKSGGAPAAAPAIRLYNRVRQAAPPSCQTNIAASTAELVAGTANLNGEIEGAVLPQPGFAECLKPPMGAGAADAAASSQAGTAAASAVSLAAARGAAAAPLSIEPATEVPLDAGKQGTISIVGGRTPLFIVAVDPGLEVKRGAATASGAVPLQLQARAAGTYRLIVGDITGAQEIVTVTVK